MEDEAGEARGAEPVGAGPTSEAKAKVGAECLRKKPPLHSWLMKICEPSSVRMKRDRLLLMLIVSIPASAAPTGGSTELGAA